MQQKQQPSTTLFNLWFWLITRLIVWIILGSFGCIAAAIVMVILHGESGLNWIAALIQNDYHYLAAMVQPQALLSVNHWLQIIPDSFSIPSVRLPVVSASYQSYVWMMIAPLIQAVLLGVKLLVIRLYLLFRWCPLFLLLGFIGMIDGLAQRYIRRAAAGRESALIYHNTKPLVMLSLIVGVFIVLALPVSVIHAEWILIGSAILLGLAIQITAKSFKKYL